MQTSRGSYPFQRYPGGTSPAEHTRSERLHSAGEMGSHCGRDCRVGRDTDRPAHGGGASQPWMRQMPSAFLQVALFISHFGRGTDVNLGQIVRDLLLPEPAKMHSCIVAEISSTSNMSYRTQQAIFRDMQGCRRLRSSVSRQPSCRAEHVGISMDSAMICRRSEIWERLCTTEIGPANTNTDAVPSASRLHALAMRMTTDQPSEHPLHGLLRCHRCNHLQTCCMHKAPPALPPPPSFGHLC